MAQNENLLAIIECIPKKDDMREGLVLAEFLHMTGVGAADYHGFTNRSELLAFLGSDALLDYDSVHLSGHGVVDGGHACFLLPRGKVYPEEFPEECFLGKTVAVSACGLGKTCFARPFKVQTGADVVIAPQREVLFVDAAVWFVNYYYRLSCRGVRPRTAYEQTEASLNGRVRGAFQFYP